MHRDLPPTRFVRANGIELAYDSFGDSAAQPLLLIAGLGTQMIMWDETFCERLAARGYRVIRFDNRDVGRSTWFPQAGEPDLPALMRRSQAGQPIGGASVPYMLADMAADAVGLLDALDITSAHVMGMSMGGAIGQEVALRYPKRTRTLVSIMATSGAPGLPPPRPAALSMLMTPTPVDREGYMQRHLDAMKTLRGGIFPEEEKYDVPRAARAFERGVNPDGYARQLAAIIASGSRKERLALLRTPTLVVHGDRDPLVPIECGMDVAHTVPYARMVTVRGMGHALPRSAWPQVIDAIAEHSVWTEWR